MWGVYSFPETFSVGAILSFNRAGWSLGMVAFGDLKDFLQFLRRVHFRGNAPCAKTAKEMRAEALPLPAKEMRAEALPLPAKEMRAEAGPAQDYCPHGFGSTSTHCPQAGAY